MDKPEIVAAAAGAGLKRVGLRHPPNLSGFNDGAKRDVK
jgi:hypothetical protein